MSKTLPWLLALLGLSGCATPTVFEDRIGMAFVLIPAGRFLMGSEEPPERYATDFPHYERSRFEKLDDEGPVHPVTITRDFYLGKNEVTVGQFRRFLEASGYVPESVADGTGAYGFNPAYDPSRTVRGDAFEGRAPRYSWADPGFPQADTHPVVNVTWHDANAMARWLTRQEGVRYRLPTEAEWEYACRAGTSGRYYNGDDPAGLSRIANVFAADTAPLWPRWREFALASPDQHVFTAPAGSFAPNAFGLNDMLGNVWEWVSDWHDTHYYAQAPREDPPGPATGVVKVRRGGSWHTWPLYARCAFRNWNTPETRYTLVGFRLVREIEAR